MSARNTPETFWARVRKTRSCWPWSGARNGCGYGSIRYGGVTLLTHRLAWSLTNGAVPEGLAVLHRCDNPACCNPAHLFLGTQDDNMKDCARKGRIVNADISGNANPSRMHPERLRRGSHHPQAKLTEQDVRAIRAEYAAKKVSQQQLAARHGVARATIGNILTRKIWQHV
jgi:predicted DNA-binding protein (UPF0251 family)